MKTDEILKTGKLVVKGKIRLLSPCHIGSGMDELTDMDLVRDSSGIPFIPATSFAGVLRHFTETIIKVDSNILRLFWGFADKTTSLQSAFYCKDLIPSQISSISKRDGVAIDNTSGRAKEGAKFDFEIIEKDSLFDLYVEIDLIKGFEESFKALTATIVNLLKSKRIRLGAKTKAGFGRITLENEAFYLFDFHNKKDILSWLNEDSWEKTNFNEQPFDLKEDNLFKLTAQFSIKNSLIVRSYTGDPSEPDAVHISSLNQPILPGTSLKGAIRARADRIINTLGKPAQIIDDLFGYVREDKKEARASRITVDEAILEGYPSEVQTRIKIDRFTGGVMEGALLEAKPLFSNRDGKTFEITISIDDCKDYEAGLMLLILKDLWTGDLPIGGEKSIGRGVLKGKSAAIQYRGKGFTINEHLQVHPPEGSRELEVLVESLNKLKPKEDKDEG